MAANPRTAIIIKKAARSSKTKDTDKPMLSGNHGGRAWQVVDSSKSQHAPDIRLVFSKQGRSEMVRCTIHEAYEKC